MTILMEIFSTQGNFNKYKSIIQIIQAVMVFELFSIS